MVQFTWQQILANITILVQFFKKNIEFRLENVSNSRINRIFEKTPVDQEAISKSLVIQTDIILGTSVPGQVIEMVLVYYSRSPLVVIIDYYSWYH